MDFGKRKRAGASPSKHGQGTNSTRARTFAFLKLRDPQINLCLGQDGFRGQITSEGANIVCDFVQRPLLLTFSRVGRTRCKHLSSGGTTISAATKAPSCWPSARFPFEWCQSPFWTCTKHSQGNTSGLIRERFLLGLMALPGDWLFSYGLIHPWGATGAESAAPGVGHHNGLYGHRHRACGSRWPCPDARPLVTELYMTSSRVTTKSEQKRQADITIPVTEQHCLS